MLDAGEQHRVVSGSRAIRIARQCNVTFALASVRVPARTSVQVGYIVSPGNGHRVTVALESTSNASLVLEHSRSQEYAPRVQQVSTGYLAVDDADEFALVFSVSSRDSDVLLDAVDVDSRSIKRFVSVFVALFCISSFFVKILFLHLFIFIRLLFFGKKGILFGPRNEFASSHQDPFESEGVHSRRGAGASIVLGPGKIVARARKCSWFKWIDVSFFFCWPSAWRPHNYSSRRNKIFGCVSLVHIQFSFLFLSFLNMFFPYKQTEPIVQNLM